MCVCVCVCVCVESDDCLSYFSFHVYDCVYALVFVVFTRSSRSPRGHRRSTFFLCSFSHYKPRRHTERRNLHLHAGPPPHDLFFIAVAKCSIAVHHIQFEMTIGNQLFFQDVVLGSEHLADLHKGFVLGLRENEDGVDGHSQADSAEDQVTVRTCSYLWREDRQYKVE